MVLLADKKEGKLSGIAKAEHSIWSGEAMVFCPRCKALQTVSLAGNTLMPTRKFTQKRSQIYHDCGSSQPCHLYHSW